MKDYKLSEIQEICKKYYPTCCTETGRTFNCPLYDGGLFFRERLSARLDFR